MLNQNPFGVIEGLYKEHYTYLRHFLIGLTKSDELADDIIQELFAKMLTDPAKTQQVTHMKSWLVKAAKNTFLDHYRKKKPELLYDESVIESLLIENQTPESKMMIQFQIKTALGHLSTQDQAIFLAKFHYGYHYQEISTLLDIPVPTLKSKIFRMRKQMAKERCKT
ncbi:RNA polymerase sigma factor [Lederbergia ruris]|uniref:RNA polymerase sigma factor n=1 Tax=Lederbergia ruris TaxID=217495 RepID=A0ABQ4KJF9_9BACI|nr:RNA polymerase sigma factor [Lederbergia ruris]GIN57264.1 RNA polymerase sigma factor [Lederbergia ruris]